jgi:(p)ppGpp synthase/HD superfamily hydrolase
MDPIKVADLVARMAHHQQVDKIGTAYIEHPRAVASFLDTQEEKVIALLHDVLEDSFLTEADLRPVFGDRITDTVALLTRREDEDYFAYIDRIKGDPLATRIKLADLRHNTDRSRITEPAQVDYDRWEKYDKAIEILTQEGR